MPATIERGLVGFGRLSFATRFSILFPRTLTSPGFGFPAYRPPVPKSQLHRPPSARFSHLRTLPSTKHITHRAPQPAACTSSYCCRPFAHLLRRVVNLETNTAPPPPLLTTAQTRETRSFPRACRIGRVRPCRSPSRNWTPPSGPSTKVAASRYACQTSPSLRSVFALLVPCC